MVSINDEKELILQDIISDSKGIEFSLKLLKSYRKRFWKKKDVKRMLATLNEDYTLLGINYFLLENFADTYQSFGTAFSYLSEFVESFEITDTDFSMIETVSAGYLAGKAEEVEKLAEKLFLAFDRDYTPPKTTDKKSFEQVLFGRNGIAALLGWIANRDVNEIEEFTMLSDKASAQNQFRMWGKIALAGKMRDVNNFNKTLEELAAFVKKQIRYGDYKYSHERDLYLPGILLLYLARRDGLEIEIPKLKQIPEKVLDLEQLAKKS